MMFCFLHCNPLQTHHLDTFLYCLWMVLRSVAVSTLLALLLKNMVSSYTIWLQYKSIIPHSVVGLAGDNDLQNAEIGSIVDYIVDIGKCCENVMKETDEAKKVCMYINVSAKLGVSLLITFLRVHAVAIF